MAGATSDREPAAVSAPSRDEQSEHEQLRAEVRRLRAELTEVRQPGPAAGAGQGKGDGAAGRKRQVSWRSPVSAVLIVVGCVLAPLAVLAVWAANQVSNTSRYVANVAPLIHQPAIQGALTDNQEPARDRTQRLQGHVEALVVDQTAHGEPQ